MNVEEILLDLKNKIYKPVYFLHGEEEYYIDIISDYIAKNVLGEADQEFNQTVLYGKDVNSGTIIDTARRFPGSAPDSRGPQCSSCASATGRSG